MIKAINLKVGDRITFTGFKRHNSEVVRVEHKDSFVKLTLLRDYMSTQEGEERPDGVMTIISPKKRLFMEAV